MDSISHDAPRVNLLERWKIRSLRDAYTERPPVQYVIENLFPLPSLNVLYGAPGTKKSMVLADAAACVAAGASWLEPLPTEETQHVRPFKTMQAPVLWIDYDNGTQRTDERFAAVSKARELAEDAPIHYASMAIPWFNATDGYMVRELVEAIRALGAKLVVIDNLGLISGDADENSADMVTVMGNLRRLAEDSGAAVVVIHHQRKGSIADRAGDLLRGHSSIEAALDLALLVTSDPQSGKITVRPTKVRGAAIESEFCGEFSYTHKPGSRELSQARFWGVPTMSAKELENREIAKTVLLLLNRANGTPVNQSDLTKNVAAYIDAHSTMKKPGRDRIRGVLNSMVADNRLLVDEGDKGALIYRLP